MKYLTKSRFKQGLECPIKLTSNYKSSEKNDDFLAALADGGFQAEELSRLHYKNGVLIEEYDYDISESKTTLYEGFFSETIVGFKSFICIFKFVFFCCLNKCLL